MCLSNLIIFFPEDSEPEPDDPSNDNIDADKVLSASNQFTQTEDIVDLSMKPSEVDTTNGEELTYPSQDETDV